MSTAQEQLRYIPCNLCNIVLAVSVPCSSLFEMVTVRCGHCTNVWSVNMAAAAPFHHSLASTIPPPPHPFLYNHRHHHLHQAQEYRIDLGSCSRYMSSNMLSPNSNRVVNRPPEKRQRVPSAYNQFIKEEIQRIKASNPDITHREAFSTAAKNWAHFPHIHFGAMLETNNQPN